MFQSHFFQFSFQFHHMYLRVQRFIALQLIIFNGYFASISLNRYKFSKRVLDIGISIFLLFILSPIFIATALIIKLTDYGPVLYWQKRVGLKGKLFYFPKFRSMIVDAESQKKAILQDSHHTSSITFKMKNDPRVTTIGKIIRKLSIDELPQFFCVIKGDMTLIGPRPCLPKEAFQYSVKERLRLEGKPGLSCIWQISGRADIPFDQQFLMDLDYLNNRSLFLDMKILCLTVPAVIFGKGAY